jgi:hypothetical protein
MRTQQKLCDNIRGRQPKSTEITITNIYHISLFWKWYLHDSISHFGPWYWYDIISMIMPTSGQYSVATIYCEQRDARKKSDLRRRCCLRIRGFPKLRIIYIQMLEFFTTFTRSTISGSRPSLSFLSLVFTRELVEL